MRKLFFVISSFIFALILCIFFIPNQVNALSPFEEATIMKDNVNMRLRPDTSSPIILKLSKGTRIGVFEEETDGWLRIIYGNYRGYISKNLVFLPSVNTVSANANIDDLSVRMNPGEFSSVVATVNAGEGMTVKDYDGDWCLVETIDGETGYVELGKIQESSSKSASSRLKKGMSGAEVSKAQRALRSRGFFDGSITGNFGDQTETAIIAFQKKAQLTADGVAGEKTLELLYGDNDIKVTAAERVGITGKVTKPKWDDIKDSSFKKGTRFTIIDVKTGLSFKCYRWSGYWHSDSTPVSKEDTATMKKIYGGSWSWSRRAIWVVVGGKTYAASMNGMPHMQDPNSNDNFPGHFCVHFYQSKVHQSGKQDPAHQSAVDYAYKRGNQ